MIDPNIWQSEDFSKLSNLSKVIFIGLFSLADDEGYGKANPTLINNSIFPFDEELRTTDIEKSLQEIATNMSIVFYTAEDGKNYYCLRNWYKWQSIQKPTKSKIPSLTSECKILFQNDYSSTTVGLQPNKNDCNLLSENDYSRTTVGLQPNRKEENKNRIEKNKKENECSDGFAKFWDLYPRKVGKLNAEIAFNKIRADDKLLEIILNGLRSAKNSRQWKSDNGKFIPYPTTWLNSQGWTDELDVGSREYTQDSGTVF